MKVTKEHIQKIEERQDCFFGYGTTWFPGWAIGKIELPIVHDSVFYLVRDSSGQCHWISSSEVCFRGQIHLFEISYYKDTFNWKKIDQFPPVL